MALSKQDYYAILGVPQNATQDEIRAKYWQLAKDYHPDIQTDAATKKLAEEEMAKITQAYKILSDPIQRAEVDKKPSTGTAVANRVVTGLSTIHGALTGQKMGNYVHKAEQTIGWQPEGFARDVEKIAKGARNITQVPEQGKNEKPKKSKKDESAMSILKKRYAKGEITKSQYMQMKKEIE